MKKVTKDKEELKNVTVVSVNPDLTVNVNFNGITLTKVRCMSRPSVGNALMLIKGSSYVVI